MGKQIYSIGFFLTALFVSFGLYTSYHFSAMREEILDLQVQVSGQKTRQVDSISANIPNTTIYTFEVYDTVTGAYSQDEYRLISYAPNSVVLRQTKKEAHQYILKDNAGYVGVYLEDGITIYEYTAITMLDLPIQLQEEIKTGKRMETLEELYSFLENYSS